MKSWIRREAKAIGLPVPVTALLWGAIAICGTGGVTLLVVCLIGAAVT